jgi:hypothetical protein
MPRTKPLKTTRTEAEVTRECMQVLDLFRGAIVLERQNTGGAYNASGQYVAFNRPGAADFSGFFAAGAGTRAGSRFELELKREGFDPRRARGKSRDRFRLQFERLRRLNEAGGVGLWCRSAEDLLDALPKILAGARVEFDADGFPYLLTEPS